jgi:hypothetical protein
MSRFEHRREPLASAPVFRRRVARHSLVAFAIVAVSLALGTLGYHEIAALPWTDALLNASMILTGMGPVDALHGVAAKLFASAYALYSGIAFLAVTGLLIAPFLHRLLHRLHCD